MPASLAVQARKEAAWRRVLDLVAEGHSLRTACQLPGLPSRSTAYRWARADVTRARQLERAMEWRLWTLADQVAELADAGRFAEADALMRYISKL